MGRVLPFAALQWLTLDHTRRDAVDRFHGLVATDPRPELLFRSLVTADTRPHTTIRLVANDDRSATTHGKLKSSCFKVLQQLTRVKS